MVEYKLMIITDDDEHCRESYDLEDVSDKMRELVEDIKEEFDKLYKEDFKEKLRDKPRNLGELFKLKDKYDVHCIMCKDFEDCPFAEKRKI